MKTNFTPGPWAIGEYPSGFNEPWEPNKMRYDRSIFSCNDQVKIATIEQWIGEKEEAEAEANAKLLAAAPCLYAACKALMAIEKIEHNCSYCHSTKCSKNCPVGLARAALQLVEGGGE